MKESSSPPPQSDRAQASGDSHDDRLATFSARLDQKRRELLPSDDDAQKGSKRSMKMGPGLARAMRLSTELLAGLIVGTVLGVLIDRMTGLAPLFLLLGIAFGFAAGLRNLQRALKEDDTQQGSDDQAP